MTENQSVPSEFADAFMRTDATLSTYVVKTAPTDVGPGIEIAAWLACQ